MINKITYQNMLTQVHNIQLNTITPTRIIMQSNITDEQLLDEEITIVPSTLSPGTFSTQVSQRLGIRSLSMRIADAVRQNKSNDESLANLVICLICSSKTVSCLTFADILGEFVKLYAAKFIAM